jgi:hypothetical protein
MRVEEQISSSYEKRCSRDGYMLIARWINVGHAAEGGYMHANGGDVDICVSNVSTAFRVNESLMRKLTASFWSLRW